MIDIIIHELKANWGESIECIEWWMIICLEKIDFNERFPLLFYLKVTLPLTDAILNWTVKKVIWVSTFNHSSLDLTLWLLLNLQVETFIKISLVKCEYGNKNAFNGLVTKAFAKHETLAEDVSSVIKFFFRIKGIFCARMGCAPSCQVCLFSCLDIPKARGPRI